MIKTILLLTPVYVTLFWALALNFYPGFEKTPRRFLGKFMLACFFVYLSHFLYFSSVSSILRWLDPFYQLSSLLVYPLYYIYFRILTKDKEYSNRKHGPYLIPALIVFLFYSAGAYLMPGDLFLQWVYQKGQPSPLFWIKYMNVMILIIRTVFISQVILCAIGNSKLIQTYGQKAKQFYSDMEESSSMNINILNLLLIVCGTVSIIISALGRRYFISEMAGIAIVSVVFSIALFYIGWIGIRQRVVNPSYEEPVVEEVSIDDLPAGNRQQITEKILQYFDNERIHLNSKLTIQDVAQRVGTNRTYVSSIINQQFGVNFCTFVNNYRIHELEKVLLENKDMTNQMLAESSGFGSVDSLKRAIFNKAGLNMTAWKAQIFANKDR